MLHSAVLHSLQTRQLGHDSCLRLHLRLSLLPRLRLRLRLHLRLRLRLQSVSLNLQSYARPSLKVGAVRLRGVG